MVVGQIGGIKVDPMVRVVFFDLFLFATGYKVGPQFFRGLGRQALSQASLTVVLCVTSSVRRAGRQGHGLRHGDRGRPHGGAFTESTVIGTAGDAIRRLALPAAEETRLLNNIPVAYAVSYLVGTTFVVWLLSSLAPGCCGSTSAREARELEAPWRLAGRRPTRLGLRRVGSSCVRPARGALVGRTVREIEKTFEAQRLFIERARRDGEICDSGPTSASATTTSWRSPAGAVPSWRRRRTLGTEVEDTQLLGEPLVTAESS